METTRFIADAMLGSLTRKLRAIGYDTSYYKTGDDRQLVNQATSEARVILTSDRALHSFSSSLGVPAILVEGTTDQQRMSSIAKGAGESGIPLVAGNPLCSICGGNLQTLTKRDAMGHVPPSVLARHRMFMRCTVCGHFYWKGSHWKKLRSHAKRLGAKRHATHE